MAIVIVNTVILITMLFYSFAVRITETVMVEELLLLIMLSTAGTERAIAFFKLFWTRYMLLKTNDP